MKKIILFGSLLLIAFFSNAQILPKLKERVKQKVEARTNEKVDKTVDTAFNKTERKVDNTVKGKPGDKNKNDGTAVDSSKKDNESNVTATSFKVYSKYDFVPGEKIVVYEDFNQDAIGDFPDKWNTNASAEVVTIEGKPGHWLMFTKAGFFRPEYIDSFPDNFTFEFDLLNTNPTNTSDYEYFFFSIANLNDISKLTSWWSAPDKFHISTYPGRGDKPGNVSVDVRKKGSGEAANSTATKQFNEKKNPVRISIWRQKERVRIYYNEEKVWDLPKAMVTDAQYNSIIFKQDHVNTDNPYCITNLRLAVGAPDTRNKFITQGKWVTHGILFDVNSANIKPESYGTLKEIANVLKENPDIKVKIVGHTDADGKDEANLDLSKRRAAAVKEALAKEFGIDESRMETDGKGESEPIDKHDDPAGKANNRRVEFIKI
jgi:outer membrane protein OmpA-like peptidoglycan-associated protein